MLVIKAIIFDCFGVLAIDSWLPFKDEYFGDNPELLNRATELNQQANGGQISNQEFISEISKLAGVTEHNVSQQIDRNPANRPLFDYIATELKGKFKLGVLSNASSDWTSRLFTPDQLGLFDAIVMSYQIGYIKPDPRAYNAISEKLGSSPEQCVFIDDQERHCDAARQAGMIAIWYQNFQQFKSDINAFLYPK